MSQFFLSKEEVQDLTGRTRKDSQALALRYMGIEHRLRPDGSIAVLRAHVEQTLGLSNHPKEPKSIEPNWNGL